VTAEDVYGLARTVLNPETIRWIVSGDTQVASRAVPGNQGNQLGRLHALSLGR